MGFFGSNDEEQEDSKEESQEEKAFMIKAFGKHLIVVNGEEYENNEYDEPIKLIEAIGNILDKGFVFNSKLTDYMVNQHNCDSSWMFFTKKQMEE